MDTIDASAVTRNEQQIRKRRRLSGRESNSDTSSGTANDLRALRNTLSPSQSASSNTTHPDAVDEDISSGEADNTDDDDNSSSESSEDSVSDSDAESSGRDTERGNQDPIFTVRGAQKPPIQRPDPSDLKAQLAAFLPKMAAANASLRTMQEQGLFKGKSFEDVDDEAEGGYIEMDLGLGVLEEKKDGEDPSDGSGDEDGDEDGADILGQLMGRKNGRQPVEIAEVEDAS